MYHITFKQLKDYTNYFLSFLIQPKSNIYNYISNREREICLQNHGKELMKNYIGQNII